jgi:hypothetical protein
MKIRVSVRSHISLTSSSLAWRLNLNREGATQPISFVHANAEPPKAKKETPTDGKGKTNSQPM